MPKANNIQISKESKARQIKKITGVFVMRYLSWLAIGLACLILLAGYFFLIGPKYKRIVKEVKLVGEDKQSQYLDRQKYLNQIEELKAAFDKVDIFNLDKIEQMLPIGGEQEELLAQIENIILKNGLMLTSLIVKTEEKAKNKTTSRRNGAATSDSVSKADLPKGVRRVKIQMKIVGTDYVGLKNLLNSIENNLRLIDIVGLEFHPAENMTSLDMFTYYVK